MNASNASLALATGEAAPTTSVRQPPVIREPVWVKWLLITVGLGWFAALLLLPLALLLGGLLGGALTALRAGR